MAYCREGHPNVPAAYDLYRMCTIPPIYGRTRDFLHPAKMLLAIDLIALNRRWLTKAPRHYEAYDFI